VCRPKHVEQLRNSGIINSTTRLHLVGSFYEFYDCLQFRYQLFRYVFCTTLSKFLNHLNICILTLLLYFYDIPNHYCTFLCLICPWWWPKKAETCWRFTICLCTIVSNYGDSSDSSERGRYLKMVIKLQFHKRWRIIRSRYYVRVWSK